MKKYMFLALLFTCFICGCGSSSSETLGAPTDSTAQDSTAMEA